MVADERTPGRPTDADRDPGLAAGGDPYQGTHPDRDTDRDTDRDPDPNDEELAWLTADQPDIAGEATPSETDPPNTAPDDADSGPVV
jgi:hypothetical protein